MQKLKKQIDDYIITNMRDTLDCVTIKKEGSQYYHSSKVSCTDTWKHSILTIRTELFLDNDSSKSCVAVTVFIEGEDTDYRVDFSCNAFKEAVNIIDGFIEIKVVQHR